MVICLITMLISIKKYIYLNTNKTSKKCKFKYLLKTRKLRIFGPILNTLTLSHGYKSDNAYNTKYVTFLFPCLTV